jgi:hypothetical protein
MRRGRRHDIFDQPWVPIAAVIGVVAVIAIAAFFFLGGGGSAGSSAAPTTPASTGGSSAAKVAVTGTINPAAIKEQKTISVPAEGVYVKVSYLGSFSGSYGTEGALVTARDSGEKIYPIENANGTLSATFKKTDTSTKQHDLTVEIWKDGKVLKFEKNLSPGGEVSLSQLL